MDKNLVSKNKQTKEYNAKTLRKMDEQNNPKTDEAFYDHRRPLQKKDRRKGKKGAERWILSK
jgi:hypothetical protein